MVNYKVYPDNLPATPEELEILANKILVEKVLNNPKYVYNKLGFSFHSGTSFSINGKCLINLSGLLVIEILKKDYDLKDHYAVVLFGETIQRKLNKFDAYLRLKEAESITGKKATDITLDIKEILEANTIKSVLRFFNEEKLVAVELEDGNNSFITTEEKYNEYVKLKTV